MVFRYLCRLITEPKRYSDRKINGHCLSQWQIYIRSIEQSFSEYNSRDPQLRLGHLVRINGVPICYQVLVQAVHLLHVLIGDLEMINVPIGLDAFFGYRFGQGNEPML